MGLDWTNEMEPPTQHSYDLLRDSLSEAQATVRSYDTKAQIVGVGYIFALGIVGQMYEALGGSKQLGILEVMIAWGIVILPILLFGFVLYPTRKTAPSLSGESKVDLQHVLYVEQGRHASVQGLVRAASQADAMRELAFELLKVSKLRELKRQRFLRALFASGVAFLVLFAAQFFKAAT